MRKLVFALCLFAVPTMASDIYLFNLLPADGAIAGTPGSTIGWGYSIANQSSTDWLVPTGVTANVFTSAKPNLIFDFPDLGPGESVTIPFDASVAIPQGFFELTWDPSVPIGFTNSGMFDVDFQWWSGEPGNGGSFVSSAPDFSTGYSATAVPEPSYFGFMAALTGTLILRRRGVSLRRSRRSWDRPICESGAEEAK